VIIVYRVNCHRLYLFEWNHSRWRGEKIIVDLVSYLSWEYLEKVCGIGWIASDIPCVLMPVDTVSKSLLSELNETNNEAADSPAGQVFSLVVISVGRDETTKFRWEVTLKCTPPISLKKINETTPSDDPRPKTNDHDPRERPASIFP
jgi:hypothetical protein